MRLPNSYALCYESGIKNSYIILKAQGLKIENYQIKMIRSNQLQNLLSFHEKAIDKEIWLCYDITSKLSLSDFSKLNEITYSILNSIVKSLIHIVQIQDEYLLNENGLIIQMDTVFINPENNSISFMYVPTLDEGTQLVVQIKDLIQILFPFIHKQDEKAIGFIHKLSIMMEQKQFSILTLKELLNDEEAIKLPEPKQVETKHEEIISASTMKKKKEIKTSQKSDFKTKQKSESNKVQRKDSTIKSQDSKEKKAVDLDAKLTFTVLQIFIIIILIICYPRLGQIKAEFKLISLCGFVLMILLCEILIFTKILKPSTNEKYESDLKNNKNSTKWGINIKKPYLVQESGVKYPILRNSFLIGKLKDHVDLFVDNELISRIHCKIYEEDGAYYLIDLNSTNGTIINNLAIKSGEKYLLEDGAMIHIANERYQFNLTQA